jgi:hypothetical protein
MFQPNQRRHFLNTSGKLVTYFFTASFGFGVVLILCGSLGYMDSAQFLVNTCTPFLLKGFITIGCFGSIAVLVESCS